MSKINLQNSAKQACFGLTAAGVLSAYALCLCATLNQGIVVALICILLYTLFSVKKEFIYAPSPLFAVIFFFLLQFNTFAGAVISLVIGGLFSFALGKISKHKKVPDFITGGCFVGLALCATILFTNTYFGIGARGFTPLEMLKSYRSLGFHPDFRGLLYGTITLFTMITYPFKFRKLKNIIPPEFITVFIPFVLNLILNPNPLYTTTNEYSGIVCSDLTFSINNSSVIYGILTTGVATGFILYMLLQSSPQKKAGGFYGSLPVTSCNSRHFSGIAPLVSAVVPSVIILLCPSLIQRLPLPCAGAMLIVSAWQHTPFKPLSATFKEKSVIKLLFMILCSVSFVILPVFFAVIFCIAVWLTADFLSHRKGAKA